MPKKDFVAPKRDLCSLSYGSGIQSRGSSFPLAEFRRRASEMLSEVLVEVTPTAISAHEDHRFDVEVRFG